MYLPHICWVVGALAACEPAGAVVPRVHAGARARSAGDGACLGHKLGVVHAFTLHCPHVTLGVAIGAAHRAHAANHRTRLEDRPRLALAHALARPPAATRRSVVAARLRAHTARQRTRLQHVFLVVSVALATLCPIRTVGLAIVAEHGGGRGGGGGEEEHEPTDSDGHNSSAATVTQKAPLQTEKTMAKDVKSQVALIRIFVFALL